MPTTFSDILTGAVMQDIDDVRWQQQLEENPALFFRSKSQVLINSIPRFNKPPEMEAYLAYDAPAYDDYTFVIENEPIMPYVVHTHKTGFDLASAITVIREANAVKTCRLDIDYDPETGRVQFNAPMLQQGQEIEIDFYTDGTFVNDLTVRQQRILGMCVAYDWYRQFAGTYLGITPKVIDPKFKVNGTESGKIRADTERMNYLEAQLNGELNNYERACAYAKRVPSGKHIYP